MAKLQLSQRAKIEVEEDGKITRTFSVNFKKLTRKESKKLGKDNEDVMDTFNKAQSLVKRAEVLEAKIEALKGSDKKEEIIKVANKLETLYDDQDALEDKFEKIGGVDKLLEASNLSYHASVTGKDKEALAEFAENESSYSEVLQAIDKDIKDKIAKHR
ncbi:MAG: hypothetical protein J7L21_04645 [Sulfurimonas sp.]|nr:hypothetical protein [Sulfurimonas sp.]